MNEQTRKRSGRHNDRRTYDEPDLDDVPIDPKRWRYVLNRLLKLHDCHHSVKDKGVSNMTMAERARFLHAQFQWLRVNEKKQYKLDPRSLSRAADAETPRKPKLLGLLI